MSLREGVEAHAGNAASDDEGATATKSGRGLQECASDAAAAAVVSTIKSSERVAGFTSDAALEDFISCIGMPSHRRDDEVCVLISLVYYRHQACPFQTILSSSQVAGVEVGGVRSALSGNFAEGWPGETECGTTIDNELCTARKKRSNTSKEYHSFRRGDRSWHSAMLLAWLVLQSWLKICVFASPVIEGTSLQDEAPLQSVSANIHLSSWFLSAPRTDQC